MGRSKGRSIVPTSSKGRTMSEPVLGCSANDCLRRPHQTRASLWLWGTGSLLAHHYNCVRCQARVVYLMLELTTDRSFSLETSTQQTLTPTSCFLYSSIEY